MRGGQACLLHRVAYCACNGEAAWGRVAPMGCLAGGWLG